ncbi:hypothetical protein [Streptomyces sp. NPDC048521]|uniref:hypothetical protein n=1 Tax=Streptomyces sp. NPDC048521 TaxID=3365566 RepID=UPI003714410F
MDEIYQMLAERTGRQFLHSLRVMPEFETPKNIGRIRINAAIVGIDLDLGFVDMDPVNLGDLASIAARRAEGLRIKHAQATRPTLRLIGGA